MRVNSVGCNQPFSGLFLNEKSTRAILEGLSECKNISHAKFGASLINKLKNSTKADVYGNLDNVSVVDKVNHKSYSILNFYKTKKDALSGNLFVNAIDQENGIVRTFIQTVPEDSYNALDSFSSSPNVQKLFAASVIESNIPSKLSSTAVYA